MKRVLPWSLLLCANLSLAQHEIHLGYHPSGVVIMLPFHETKIYTDTTALNYILGHPHDAEYAKYFARAKNLLSSLYRRATDDTIVLESEIPFEDSIDLAPRDFYVGAMIFTLIDHGLVKMIDDDGNNVEKLRITNPRNEPPNIITTIYSNAATKKELFRDVVCFGELFLVKSAHGSVDQRKALTSTKRVKHAI